MNTTNAKLGELYAPEEYNSDATSDAELEGYIPGESYAGVGNLLKVLKPLAYEDNLMQALGKALRPGSSDADVARIMRAQKGGFIADPLDPGNLLDLSDPKLRLTPSRIQDFMKDVEQNKGGFGYRTLDEVSQGLLEANPSSAENLRMLAEDRTPWTAQHVQTSFKNDAPGSHFTGSDAEHLKQARAETAAGEDFRRNNWGPAVYSYDATTPAARDVASMPHGVRFTKQMGGERNIVAPQLRLDQQTPEAIEGLRKIFDFGSTEGEPVINAMRQLNTRYPNLETLKMLRDAGLHGSVELDRNITPAAKFAYEHGDYDFLKTPWAKQ